MTQAEGDTAREHAAVAARTGGVRNARCRKKKHSPTWNNLNQVSSAIPENQGREKGIHHPVTQVMSVAGEPSAALIRFSGTNNREPQHTLLAALPYRPAMS